MGKIAGCCFMSTCYGIRESAGDNSKTYSMQYGLFQCSSPVIYDAVSVWTVKLIKLKSKNPEA